MNRTLTIFGLILLVTGLSAPLLLRSYCMSSGKPSPTIESPVQATPKAVVTEKAVLPAISDAISATTEVTSTEDTIASPLVEASKVKVASSARSWFNAILMAESILFSGPSGLTGEDANEGSELLDVPADSSATNSLVDVDDEPSSVIGAPNAPTGSTDGVNPFSFASSSRSFGSPAGKSSGGGGGGGGSGSGGPGGRMANAAPDSYAPGTYTPGPGGWCPPSHGGCCPPKGHCGCKPPVCPPPIACVPEPSTIVIWSALMVGMVGYGWRRSRMTKSFV